MFMPLCYTIGMGPYQYDMLREHMDTQN